MDLQEGLNREQLKAVTHTKGPLLIMAGAGSGKTKVLVTRIAYLMAEEKVQPRNILAITFTNKAAKEMLARIEKLTGSRSQGMFIGTFHALGVRILRKHSEAMGLASNFVIYDDHDQLVVIKEILKKMNLDEKKFAPRAVLSAISNAKNKLWDSRQYKKYISTFFEEKVAQIYAGYEKVLHDNQAVDFDDLIMKPVLLLQQNKDILAEYQEQFRYILVDEYQDTNNSQYVLVNMLASKYRNICVVGDPDQSIYGWRGADIANILDFEKDYADAKVIKLEQNYRSTQNILKAANQVIANNRNRKEKKLWTDGQEGCKIVYQLTEDEKEEAFFVANKIRQIRNEENYRYKDMAILYRTHTLSRALEDMFVKLNMPYVIYGGMKFYERKEIKDTLAYLRYFSNPDDEVSLMRIINEPKRGIGNTTWAKLSALAQENGITVGRMFRSQPDLLQGLTGRNQKNIQIFADFVALISQKVDLVSITELVEEIWEKSGYQGALLLEKNPENEARMENMKEFLSVTKDYEERLGVSTLADFLAEISLSTDQDQGENADDYVTMMSLHSAKGLEFPVVFMVGMEEKIFPHFRSLTDDGEMEEERRLCYVGMTRAQKKLYMVRSYRRMLWGQSSFNQESRFMKEISDDLLENTQQRSFISNKVSPKKCEPQKDPDLSIGLGDQVEHGKFGVGVVVQAGGKGDSKEVNVAFPGQGIKKFILKYAPLKKI